MPLHVVAALSAAAHGVHEAPQVAVELLSEHVAPLSQVWWVPSQTTPHVAVALSPEQVVDTAPADSGHGVHDDPHVAVLPSLEHDTPLSQLWDPAAHAKPHAPPVVHVAIPPDGAGHGVHDDPHVAGCVLSEQVTPLSQLWKPPLQLEVHVLIEHDAEPFCGTGHAWPQLPQFAPLDVVSTQLPLHDVSVAGEHPSVHPPPEQSGVEPEHEFEQLPQVCAVPRLASHPSFGFEEQWPYPDVHADAGTSHTPLLHVTPEPLTFGRAVQS